jgi:hypothetical protein
MIIVTQTPLSRIVIGKEQVRRKCLTSIGLGVDNRSVSTQSLRKRCVLLLGAVTNVCNALESDDKCTMPICFVPGAAAER